MMILTYYYCSCYLYILLTLFVLPVFFAALTANVAMSKSPVRAESRLAAAPVCLTYLESMNLFDLNTLGIVPYNRVI